MFVLLLDSGIVLDNVRSESKRQKERSELSMMLLKNSYIGENKSIILKFIDFDKEDKRIIKIREDSIEIDDIVFQIENNVIVKIHYID